VKIDGLFEILDRYFLDFIGTVIPGTTFVAEICILFKQPLVSSKKLEIASNNGFNWIFYIILGYILGHALSSIGKNIIVDFLEYLKTNKYIGWLLPKFITPKKQLFEKVQKRIDYKQLVSKATKYFSIEAEEESDFSSWRSIAMSLAEDNSLPYRFMFLSLMNLGVATSILLINVFWISLHLVNGHFGISFNLLDFNLVLFILFFLVSLPFLERYYEFYRYSMEVPFSKALVKLQELENSSNEINT
jgi:hypothetical protein